MWLEINWSPSLDIEWQHEGNCFPLIFHIWRQCLYMQVKNFCILLFFDNEFIHLLAKWYSLKRKGIVIFIISCNKLLLQNAKQCNSTILTFFCHPYCTLYYFHVLILYFQKCINNYVSCFSCYKIPDIKNLRRKELLWFRASEVSVHCDREGIGEQSLHYGGLEAKGMDFRTEP
jgi:hypothetical protein